LQEDQQRQVEETRMEGPHLYDSADMYDQPIRIAINGGNPQYEMAAVTEPKHYYELSNVGHSRHCYIDTSKGHPEARVRGVS